MRLTVLAARVAIDEKTAMLRAVKSPKEKERAEAELSLARADLALALSSPEAKQTYKKRTTTVEEETDDGDDGNDDEEDEDEEDEEEDEEGEEEKMPPPAEESAEEEEEEEEEEEAKYAEEEKAAKASVSRARAALASASPKNAAARKAALATARGNLRAVQAKAHKSARAQLAAAKLQLASYKSLSSKVAKLSASTAAAKMAKSIAKAERAGKVTPGNKAKVKEFGQRFGLKALRASLATMPVIGRALVDGPSFPGVTFEDGPDMGAGGAAIAQLSPEARKVCESAIALGALNAEGKPHTLESYAVAMVAKLRAVNGGRVLPPQPAGMQGGGRPS